MSANANDIDKTIKQLIHQITELHTTEINYNKALANNINILQNIQDNYAAYNKNNILSKNGFHNNQISAFLNNSKALQAASNDLIKALQVAKGVDAAPGQLKQKEEAILIALDKYYQEFSVYTADFKLMTEAKFFTLLSEASKNSKLKIYDEKSLSPSFIEPVSRGTRYPLLFQDIATTFAKLNYTEDHTTATKLQQSAQNKLTAHNNVTKIAEKKIAELRSQNDFVQILKDGNYLIQLYTQNPKILGKAKQFEITDIIQEKIDPRTYGILIGDSLQLDKLSNIKELKADSENYELKVMLIKEFNKNYNQMISPKPARPTSGLPITFSYQNNGAPNIPTTPPPPPSQAASIPTTPPPPLPSQAAPSIPTTPLPPPSQGAPNIPTTPPPPIPSQTKPGRPSTPIPNRRPTGHSAQ